MIRKGLIISRPRDARLNALTKIGIKYYIKIRNDGEGEGENNYNYKAYN